MADVEQELRGRSQDQCELCKADGELYVHAVGPYGADEPGHAAYLCPTCLGQVTGADLDVRHLLCLNESIWSEHAPVQVLSWRLLNQLPDVWAKELLEQAYLTEETLEWAKTGIPEEDTGPPTFDSNGTRLNTGDSVTLIKDLDVKGTSFVAKRGTLVKGIRTTENPEHVEGKVNNITIVLKTAFLKKV